MDLLRSGTLGGAPAPLVGMNTGPAFRDIPYQIYNGLPVELRGAIGGPLENQTANVGIKNDGHTTAFNVAVKKPVVNGAGRTRNLSIAFNQGIPRPFCSTGPYDYVFAQSLPGTKLVLEHSVNVSERRVHGGRGTSRVTSRPRPSIPPPAATGAPTQFAKIYERHSGAAAAGTSATELYRLQTATATPGGAVTLSLEEKVAIADGRTFASSTAQCGQ